MLSSIQPSNTILIQQQIDKLKHFYESILSLPLNFIIKTKNSCERALLLDIGHLGFRIDHLLGAIHETNYALQVVNKVEDNFRLKKEQETLVCIFPLMKSVDAKCCNRNKSLESLLNQAVMQLESYHSPCLQLSQVYESTGMELMNEGITKLATEKSDVYKTLSTRIYKLLNESDSDSNELLFDLEWDSALKEIQENRGNFIKSSCITTTTSDESHSKSVITDSILDSNVLKFPSSGSSSTVIEIHPSCSLSSNNTFSHSLPECSDLTRTRALLDSDDESSQRKKQRQSEKDSMESLQIV